jgi:hypothetical protein
MADRRSKIERITGGGLFYKFSQTLLDLHALKNREITGIHYQNMYSCPCGGPSLKF